MPDAVSFGMSTVNAGENDHFPQSLECRKGSWRHSEKTARNRGKGW